MNTGTNAPFKPEFDGQIVKFISPHHNAVILYDIAIRHPRYGYLEWHAISEPTPEQKSKAMQP